MTDHSGDHDGDYHGDLVVVARYLTPTEAHLLCELLRTAHVPAEAADVHLVQTHSLLSPALGGASVKVPQDFLARAQEVIEAFRRGDFALDEDFDPGGAPPAA